MTINEAANKTFGASAGACAIPDVDPNNTFFNPLGADGSPLMTWNMYNANGNDETPKSSRHSGYFGLFPKHEKL